MSDGEKRDEEDLRAQLAVVNLSEGTAPVERTEPLTISADVPVFTYSPLTRPESMIRLLKLKPGVFRADCCESLREGQSKAGLGKWE